MKQLLLKLDTERAQTLDSFVVGRHAEMIELLQRFAQRQPGSFGERAAYLWGESGAGKTHLLRALESGPTARYLSAASALRDFECTPDVDLYLIDDCQTLDPEQQVAAFNLYNVVKERQGLFVASGNLPPAQLAVRDDLRTRLGWGLIYQLHGLTDQEKIDALERAAAALGVTLPDGILPYLITHFRRDMPSLSGMLRALINHAMELKHPITMPFLRDVMQQQKLNDE